MALNNLKAMMKEPVLQENEGKKPPTPGLLKTKPAFKMPGTMAKQPKQPSLLARLTGGK